MIALIFYLIHASTCLSPFPPEEGDVRHLYPQATISILFSSHAYTLPYLLGWLENVQYPKKRLHINLYLTPDAKEDTTREQIQWWSGQTSSLFKTLSVNEVTNLDDGKSWQEHTLMDARKKTSSFVLFWSASDLPSNTRFLPHIFNKSRPVVSSLLLPPSSHRGKWNIDSPADLLNIDARAAMQNIGRLVFPFVINLHETDSSYLTFDHENVRGYEGHESAMSVLEFSARAMSIPLLLDRSLDIGWHFSSVLPIEERRMMLRYLVADLIVDQSTLWQSRLVRSSLPRKSTFGFEKIFIINLVRRPERRRVMQRMCDVIGMECEFVDATDGRSLPSAYPVTQLDSFIDPSSARKMTNGEVGCFLSHYRIWEAMVASGMSRVLVLEDDARLVDGAFGMIREMMEDIMKKRLPWHLIYMGRKRTKEHIKKDVWVEGVRHLSTVGYSYWTVGYALSLDGASTLINGKPLERMVPVDEYIPIMADVHPKEEWAQAFQNRSLRMFTIHPLVVYPSRYTNEAGHSSDTEDSEIYEGGKRQEL